LIFAPAPRCIPLLAVIVGTSFARKIRSKQISMGAGGASCLSRLERDC
jgi:hypothetical protein